MRQGFQVSSVKKYLQTEHDVFESFEKIADIGYKAVQLQWISPSVPAKSIAKALRQNGLYSTGTQDYYDEVMPRLDEVRRENALYGSRDICVSGIPDRFYSHDGIKRMADELAVAARKAAQDGMRISFHPRAKEWEAIGDELAVELLLMSTAPEVVLLMDVYHVILACQDPIYWIRVWSDRNRLDMVHFKDKCVVDGRPVLTPVGQGETDWRPIVRACDECGIDYAFAEQESWAKDPFECFREMFAYLKGEGLEA